MRKKDHHRFRSLATLIIKYTLMKKFAILFAIIFCSQFFQNVLGQSKINLNLQTASVKEALNAIESQSDIRFVYKNDTLPENFTVTVKAEKLTVEQALDKIFTNSQLTYQRQDDELITILRMDDEPVTNVVIKGKITDDNSKPISGANISEKGTSNGTVTNNEGVFEITVSSVNPILIISNVGFTTQEINVANRSNISLQLQTASNQLDQVVVVGYGTQKAKDVTGAVGRISTREIKQVAVVSLDQALSGRLAGVQINENSAEPGGEISIRIRGVASITSGTNPLVVVDGIPMSIGLKAINPNDIESIDVLKDAASTAIYGSRASAGVILVTTKRGKNGKVSVGLDAYTGVQHVGKTLSLLSGPEFAKLANENLVNGGKPANPNWSNPSSVANTNWQDAIFRTAPMSNFNVSLSGGGEKTKALASFGYTDQDGIVRSSGYKRYTGRLNMDFDVSSRLKFGINLNYTSEANDAAVTQSEFTGALLGAIRQQPSDPVYSDQTGPFGDHLYGFKGYALRRSSSNSEYYPLTQNSVFTNNVQVLNRSSGTQFLSNAFGELEIIKGLKFKSVIGYTASTGLVIGGQAITLPIDIDVNSPSSIEESWYKGSQWNLVNTLNYVKTFGQHNLSVLVGTDALKQNGRSIYGRGSRQLENQESITATGATGRTVSGSEYVPFSLFSYLARVNYSYSNKYLISATIRRDGSSNFDESNRYGNFPSVSLGWRISEEKFMHSATMVDELKLRGSYGSVGNQNIPPLRYLSSYGTSGGNYGYSLGSPSTFVTGLLPNVLGNKEIGWETNTETNIGLDVSLLKGTFSFTADFYKKELHNLLGTVPTPLYSTPFNGSFYANAFSMKNTGIELSARFNKTIGKIHFGISGNFTANKNKVTELIPGNTSGYIVQDISIINGAYNDGNAQTRTYVGESIGSFWGYVFEGIIQNQAELDASGMDAFGATVGDKKFKDINGRDAKGELSGKPDGKVDADDKTILGNGQPGFIYGFGLNADYKGFDINVLFNGQGDVQIANMTKAALYHMRYHSSTGMQNVSSDLLNSWHGEGTSNTLPRNSYDAPTSNRFFASDYIENGAFLRLRNVQIGYTLPATFLNKVKLSRVRLYISGQNLLTITKYSGYDPEVGSGAFVDQAGNDAPRTLTTGVDYGRYPKARIFLFGASFQF